MAPRIYIYIYIYIYTRERERERERERVIRNKGGKTTKLKGKACS